MIINEIDARNACSKDGVNPDMLIAGQPAWKSYRKQPEAKPLDGLQPDALDMDSVGVMKQIAFRGQQMRELDKLNETAIKLLDKRLKGKRVLSRELFYVIDYVYSGYMGRIEAKGHRITADGKRGSKLWQIYNLQPGDFTLEHSDVPTTK